MAEIKYPTSQGNYGSSPYGDQQEASGPPEPIVEVDLSRDFRFTDARSVMAIVHPHHWNFIKNPAFRNDASGWKQTKSVLDTAVWSVHAGELTDAKDGLRDCSGSGRDALFGAGDAAPVVLPHDGDDYISVPWNNVDAPNRIFFDLGAVVTIPNGTRLTFDVRVPSAGDGSFYLLLGNAVEGSLSGVYVNGDSLYVRWTSAAGSDIHSFLNCVPNDQRCLIEVLIREDGTGADVWVDGVQATGNTAGWDDVRTPSTQTLYLMSRSGTAPGVFVDMFGFSTDDGQFVMDPSLALADGSSVPNTGTAGGNWDIYRDTQGYKIAVVDRPLLLFGGAQHAASPALPEMSEMTIVVSGFSDHTSGVQTLINQRPQYTGTEGWSFFRSGPTWYFGHTGNNQVLNRNTEDFEIGVVRLQNGGVIDSWINDYREPSLPDMPVTWFDTPLVLGAFSTSNGYAWTGEIAAAAIFDRALTDEEIAEATQAMENNIVPNKVDLDDTDSWVGQSVVVSDPTALRFQDVDKDGNPALIYVGPMLKRNEKDWYEHGRSSAEWTLSTYVKGSGRVRLSMYAYLMDDGADPMSPPKYANLKESTDPENAPFDESTTALKGPDGTVWTLDSGPYYTSIGRPRFSSDPTADAPADTLPLLVETPDGSLHERTSSSYPYYTDIGAPSEVADPSVADSGDQYLRSSTDGSLWKLKDPAPPAHTPDPETGGVPEGWYYHPITVQPVSSTDALRPEPSRMPNYVADAAGDLWELDPAATAAPYYTLVGSPADVTDRPLETLPTAGPVLRVQSTEPDPSVDGTYWLVKESFYTSTGQQAYFESMEGDWERVESAQDWERIVLSTTARYFQIDPSAVSFLGVHWIDAVIEVEPDEGTEMKVSAVMLDARERPEAEYFDGDMVEDPALDDFLWMGEPNNSVSLYYYDRAVRARWLYHALNYMAPAGRPYQIYFHDISLPYVPTDGVANNVATGASRLII